MNKDEIQNLIDRWLEISKMKGCKRQAKKMIIKLYKLFILF
jgi:hypothetical protein